MIHLGGYYEYIRRMSCVYQASGDVQYIGGLS